MVGDWRSKMKILAQAFGPLLHRCSHFLAWRRLILCCVAIWLTGMLTFDYYVRIEAPSIEKRISLHSDIVNGSAPYQFRYRVLIPYVAEALARLIQDSPVAHSRPMVQSHSYSKRAFVLAYCFLNSIALLILLLSVGELLWRMFGYDLALFGIVVSAFLVNFTFRDHYFQPWSFWEGAFFALGLLLIHRKSYWLFSGVSVLGLLNRETSVFLLVAFLFCTLPQTITKDNWIEALNKRDVRFAVGNLIVWVLGFFILHRVVGYRPSTFFFDTAVNGNRANLKYALVLNFLLFGSLWPLVLKGIPLSPLLIRRSAMMLPAYFGLLLVIGYWWEIRYWITVIPIVVPALIAAMASASSQKRHVNSHDG